MTILRRSGCLAAVIFSVAATGALAQGFTGTNGNDFIVGTGAADTISARAGNDTVFGLAGNDTIDAGDDNDIVYGDGSCPRGARDASYCQTGETSHDGNDVIEG